MSIECHPNSTGREKIQALNEHKRQQEKARRDRLKAAGMCVKCGKNPVDRTLSRTYCRDCIPIIKAYGEKARRKAGKEKRSSGGQRIANGRMAWPGQDPADALHCFGCAWHGVLMDHVTCDYSQYVGHGVRGCPAGRGCIRYVPEAKTKQSAKGEGLC